MIYGALTHPPLLAALASAGHGSKILLADGNYPHSTGKRTHVPVIHLNLTPGLLTVNQILEVLRHAVPFEKAEVMVPEPDTGPAHIPAHDDYRELLPDVEFCELTRFAYYEAVRSEDVALVVATGDQRLYANLLLTIGVRQSE